MSVRDDIAVLACLYAKEKADIADEMGVPLRVLRRIERESHLFLTDPIRNMIEKEMERARRHPDYLAAVKAVADSGFGARLSHHTKPLEWRKLFSD